jgi:Predicted redox protein, regulator of disulfide bond formation
MQRKASAVWQGDLKSGKGTLSTDSGVLKQTAYSFHSRFESGIGTNPEELLAAHMPDVSPWRFPRSLAGRE